MKPSTAPTHHCYYHVYYHSYQHYHNNKTTHYYYRQSPVIPLPPAAIRSAITTPQLSLPSPLSIAKYPQSPLPLYLLLPPLLPDHLGQYHCCNFHYHHSYHLHHNYKLLSRFILYSATKATFSKVYQFFFLLSPIFFLFSPFFHRIQFPALPLTSFLVPFSESDIRYSRKT